MILSSIYFNFLDICTFDNVLKQEENVKIHFAEYISSRPIDDIYDEFEENFSFVNKPSRHVLQKLIYNLDEYKRPVNIREWIICDKEKIFCVFCVCFLNSNEENILIKGISTKQLISVITKALVNHEHSCAHKISKHKYLKAASEYDSSISINYDEKTNQDRAVVKTVLKVIVFLATHGE